MECLNENDIYGDEILEIPQFEQLEIREEVAASKEDDEEEFQVLE
jgi:hypothetical protein